MRKDIDDTDSNQLFIQYVPLVIGSELGSKLGYINPSKSCFLTVRSCPKPFIAGIIFGFLPCFTRPFSSIQSGITYIS